MSKKHHNGYGTVMDDAVMSDVSVWNCIQIIETDGEVVIYDKTTYADMR